MKMNMYKTKSQKMTKKTTIAAIALAISSLATNAQTVVADFESFSLSPNSAYSPTTSVPFQTANASFQYKYSGGFWSEGFSYTNKYDSITAGFTNTHGIRAYNGYSNSATYVIGKDRGVITLATNQTTVNGFYITNTTYAYKSMASGDAFAKKFGGTTGSDPDFFKVIVKGYKNGALKNDSVTVMLADFTFTNNTQDYISAKWQFVNTTIIGDVDSLKFFMRSSDIGQFGINTPLFFAIDNFTTTKATFVGLAEQTSEINFNVYPNPTSNFINIQLSNNIEQPLEAKILDISGKTIYAKSLTQIETDLNVNFLQSGIYFLELTSGKQKTVKKIVKN
jgi:Domain of unknown function (DUF4465)/Secretion system C-terminal sorting domain